MRFEHDVNTAASKWSRTFLAFSFFFFLLCFALSLRSFCWFAVVSVYGWSVSIASSGCSPFVMLDALLGRHGAKPESKFGQPRRRSFSKVHVPTRRTANQRHLTTRQKQGVSDTVTYSQNSVLIKKKCCPGCWNKRLILELEAPHRGVMPLNALWQWASGQQNP